MGVLTLQDVRQSYEDRELLRGVSLVIEESDRIGLLGPNGSGKSTLLRILAGREVPDSGQRTTRRDLRIGYLEQDPQFEPGTTVSDAIRAGFAQRGEILQRLSAVHDRLGEVEGEELDRALAEQATLEDQLDAQGGHDVDHRVDAMIHDLGLLSATATCESLSGGERRRIALAQLLLQKHDLLILDEPTNHLDAEVTEWLEDRLLGLRCPFVLVTHDRYFLDRLVTRTIEIERGELHEYDGGYGEFLAARAARLEREQAAESTRLNLLRRETEWMRRGPPARTTKAKARIDRFDALVAGKPEAAARDLEFRIPPGPRLGEKVIELEGVTAGYGDEVLFSNMDLEIGARTRIGIVGPNGTGKSTLLKVCIGQLEPQKGSVSLGSTVRVATIDQRRSDLDPEKTVLEEVSGGNDYVHVDGRNVRVETFLEQFLFPGSMRRSKIANLSGGERNRVLLAKLLSAGGNVLVLDEPTNDLDLMTLRVLEEALIDFPGVVLVVSHDRYFLDRVATRIVHMDGHGHHRIHEGDLSLLLERLAKERADRAAKAAPKPAAKPAAETKPKVRKLSTREHAELEKLPDAIAEAEAALEQIDEKLADPSLYEGDGSAGRALGDERTAAQAEVERLYARWEELESLR